MKSTTPDTHLQSSIFMKVGTEATFYEKIRCAKFYFKIPSGF